MAEDSKALEQVKTGMLERPSFIPEGDTRGLEGVDKADIQFPRLGLAQGLSPEITPGKGRFIEGLRNGEFFNNLSREIYGKGPLQFIVVHRAKPRFIEFAPLSEGGGIRDMDVPHDDPRVNFTRDSNGKSVNPVATKFLDFVILLLKNGAPPEMLVLSFKSTGLKAARRLNGLMQAKMAPPYAGVYSLSVGSETNPKGTFNVHLIDNAGFVQDEKLYKHAARLFDNLQGTELKFEREGREPGDEDPGDFPTDETTTKGM